MAQQLDSSELVNFKVLRLIVQKNDREGIKVVSAYNLLVNTVARKNNRRGFYIGIDDNNLVIVDDNYLVNCLAEDNGRNGFIIDGGNDNKIINSAVIDSCRDGIEIKEGNDNSLINNYVADNGNPVTCGAFSQTYKPWFYAGIDITDGAEENIVINNKTSGNIGCYEEDCDPDPPIERNLLDENVDEDGNCDYANRWKNNRVDGERAEPECVAAF